MSLIYMTAFQTMIQQSGFNMLISIAIEYQQSEEKSMMLTTE